MSYNTTRTIKPLFWHLNQYCRTNGIAANGRNACTRRRHTNKHSWADGMAARDQNIPPKCSNFYEIVLYLHWALGGYVVCVFLGGRVWVANKYLLSSLFENSNTTETPESLVTCEALLISNLWFTSFSVFLSCVGPGDILTSEKAKQLGNKYQWSANKNILFAFILNLTFLLFESSQLIAKFEFLYTFSHLYGSELASIRQFS